VPAETESLGDLRYAQIGQLGERQLKYYRGHLVALASRPSKHGREAYASAPLKAYEQLGESPNQGNVTALNPTLVTAFQR